MGTLSRVGLADLVRTYGLDTLVETGTGHGHSVIAALQVPELLDIRSIELDRETWHRNVVVFATEKRVRLYHGDSPRLLPTLCRELYAQRVLWWLDAHFPGSGRLDPVPMLPDHGSVPLVHEVAALLEHRREWLEHDVIVVDDLCLFEPGAYEHDAAHLRAGLAWKDAPTHWLDQELARSHVIERLTIDGGYLIARPRL